jgi:hypothetical protein
MTGSLGNHLINQPSAGTKQPPGMLMQAVVLWGRCCLRWLCCGPSENPHEKLESMSELDAKVVQCSNHAEQCMNAALLLCLPTPATLKQRCRNLSVTREQYLWPSGAQQRHLGTAGAFNLLKHSVPLQQVLATALKLRCMSPPVISSLPGSTTEPAAAAAAFCLVFTILATHVHTALLFQMRSCRSQGTQWQQLP